MRTVKVAVIRTTRVHSSFDIVWDNVQDYTHFLPLHRKHFKQFEVLYDDQTVQIFYYTSCVLPPLPFIRRFIAVRRMDRDNHSARQVYQDLASGDKVYLKYYIEKKGEEVLTHNLFLFQLSGWMAHVPRLFAWLVNRRLAAMWQEDLEIQHVRYEMGGFTSKTCEPRLASLHAELSDRFDTLFEEIDSPTTLRCEFEEKSEK